MENEYYSAKEVSELLKTTVQTVYRKAKSGDIPAIGKRPNIQFPKEAIDAISEVGAEDDDDGRMTYTPMTVADLWEAKVISTSPYGEENDVPFKTVISWKKVCNELGMSLKEKNKLVGWVTMLPLEESTALALINNQIKEKDISPRFVKKWTDQRISVYVPVIEVVPSGNELIDTKRGTFLLRKTIKWAITLNIQHDIKNWYAVGATKDGQIILENLGFRKIAETADGKEKGYVLETTAKPVKLMARLIERMGIQQELEQKEKLLES